jgi:hypothetical protein
MMKSAKGKITRQELRTELRDAIGKRVNPSGRRSF